MASPYGLAPHWRPNPSSSTAELPLLPIYTPSTHDRSPEDALTPPPSAPFTHSFNLDEDDSHNRYRGRLDSLSSEPPTPGTRLPDSRRTMYLSWALFAATIVCCSLTIAYAFNATRNIPAIRRVIATDPKRTIAILSALSSVSAFLLAELVQSVFERVRWVLAARPGGVLLTDFLGMSRATSIAGVFALLIWKGNLTVSGFWGKLRGSKKMWLLQRFE